MDRAFPRAASQHSTEWHPDRRPDIWLTIAGWVWVVYFVGVAVALLVF